MNAKQFYETTRAMRAAQKKFFKSRSSFDLREAKRLERIIDDEIARADAIEESKQPQQLTLFDQQ